MEIPALRKENIGLKACSCPGRRCGQTVNPVEVSLIAFGTLRLPCQLGAYALLVS
jgi:hypothetical protein